MTSRTDSVSALQQALALYQRGAYEASLEIAIDFCAQQPSNVAAWRLAGAAARNLGRFGLAEQFWLKAVALNPNSTEIHFNLASIYHEEGRFLEAIERLRKVLQCNNKHYQALSNLSFALIAVDQMNEALHYADAAIAVRPDFAKAHHNRRIALEALGRIPEAIESAKLTISMTPGDTLTYRHLVSMQKVRPDDPILSCLEQLSKDMNLLTTDQQISLHFALGKAYGDIEKYDESFRHYLHGNAKYRKQIFYDETKTLQQFSEMRSAFSSDVLSSVSVEDHDIPIFIVGMPRSGSTLIEQILASHPSVFGAGECDDWRQLVAGIRKDDGTAHSSYELARLPGPEINGLGTAYKQGLRARAPGAQRITDKMPRNFVHLGLIHQALPGARIIHTQRNPVDTCMSCFSQLFVGDFPFTYDLAELGRYWRTYNDLMDHWRKVLPASTFLDMRYEELVENPEMQIKRMLDHCQLPWDERCLHFQQTDRSVRTASATQVRQPLYSSGVNRWQRYGSMIQPLVDALAGVSVSQT